MSKLEEDASTSTLTISAEDTFIAKISDVSLLRSPANKTPSHAMLTPVCGQVTTSIDSNEAPGIGLSFGKSWDIGRIV